MNLTCYSTVAHILGSAKELFRKALLTKPDFLELDEFEKFLFLNSTLQLETAKFVSKAMQIRQNLLYI